jgi:hypothetical protein
MWYTAVAQISKGCWGLHSSKMWFCVTSWLPVASRQQSGLVTLRSNHLVRRHHIPEEQRLQLHCCKSLKSHKWKTQLLNYSHCIVCTLRLDTSFNTALNSYKRFFKCFISLKDRVFSKMEVIRENKVPPNSPLSAFVLYVICLACAWEMSRWD